MLLLDTRIRFPFQSCPSVRATGGREALVGLDLLRSIARSLNPQQVSGAQALGDLIKLLRKRRIPCNLHVNVCQRWWCSRWWTVAFQEK